MRWPIDRRSWLKFLTKSLLVFGVPAVLAMPLPPPPFNSHEAKINLSGGAPAAEERSSFLTKQRALGATFLSTVLGIETGSMPGFVCLTNVSEIQDANGSRVNRADLMEDEDGGRISMTLFRDDATEIVNIPFASTTCISPVTKGEYASLSNEVKVRGFSRYGKPQLQVINDQPVVAVADYPGLQTIFALKGTSGYTWQWSSYRNNYFLFLIGWVILLSSIVQVFGWMTERHRKPELC